MVLVGVEAALTEETLFRGDLQPTLQRMLGRGPGLLLTALIFAAYHLRFGLLGSAREDRARPGVRDSAGPDRQARLAGPGALDQLDCDGLPLSDAVPVPGVPMRPRFVANGAFRRCRCSGWETRRRNSRRATVRGGRSASVTSAAGGWCCSSSPRRSPRGAPRSIRHFRDNQARIRELGGELVGVSVDKPDVQCEFARSEKIEYPLLGDSDRKISEKFGVLWPLVRINRRVTFVVSPGRAHRGGHRARAPGLAASR